MNIRQVLGNERLRNVLLRHAVISGVILGVTVELVSRLLPAAEGWTRVGAMTVVITPLVFLLGVMGAGKISSEGAP
jgi:Flp pilus assembly protein protease CpaA